ncbi:MAG TPA: TrkA C-terminal domain-containing protein, partial [Gemmatimonadaceae bacterium]|nr:TrkA C-terminal domain-containing protein [Gemmatimonadaceae bacterium]
AWLGQVVMFLVLGLLVFPSRLLAVAGEGLLIALGLAIAARPLAVALCLLPFRVAGFGYTMREIAYISWVGLRGAVPIILAVTPVLLGVRGATRLFDLVCVIVVVNAFIPGAMVRWLTNRLGLASDEPPSAPAVLDIESREPLVGDLLSFYVDEALAVAGVPLAELPFPPGAAATLVVRGRELIAPKGTTVLTPGDHVYVLTSPDDRALVELLFGRPEEDA